MLGVEERGENDQLDVYKEFKENIVRQSNERHEVKIPWIPGSELSETNESQSRKRLQNVERKLKQNEQLRSDYTDIVNSQLTDGIIEKVPDEPTGKRVFYFTYKPVAGQDEITTKTGIWFSMQVRNSTFWNTELMSACIQGLLYSSFFGYPYQGYNVTLFVTGWHPRSIFANQYKFRRYGYISICV